MPENKNVEKYLQKFDDHLAVLDGLGKLGKKTKKVEIGDVVITLSTLGSEDETEVFIACSDLSGNAYFHKLKSETLKRAIRVVNNNDLYSFLNSDLNEIDKKQLREEIHRKIGNMLREWKEDLIAYLYSEWIDLTKESEEELKKKGIIEEDEKQEAVDSDTK